MFLEQYPKNADHGPHIKPVACMPPSVLLSSNHFCYKNTSWFKKKKQLTFCYHCKIKIIFPVTMTIFLLEDLLVVLVVVERLIVKYIVNYFWNHFVLFFKKRRKICKKNRLKIIWFSNFLIPNNSKSGGGADDLLVINGLLMSAASLWSLNISL